MEPLLLGIDVGTTGTKVILTNAEGRVLAESTSEYSLSTPHALWAEQDPEDWWQATTRSVALVLLSIPRSESAIACIGLTGQMHGLVLLDSKGMVKRPAILWNDQRTEQECRDITQRVGAQRVLELTGNPLLPGFTAPKIEWVRRHEAEALNGVAHVLLPKDYIRYRLSGEFHGDVSDSSGTSLFDVGKRCWSEEMLAAFGVPIEWMPEVHESAEICCETRAMDDCMLPAGIPIVAGAGDQAAQGIGAGIVEEGTISATFGTSGVVFAASDSYRVDPLGRLHAFCHAVPGKWHMMGVVLSAGGSLRWFRDALCEGAGGSYEEMVRAAAQVEAGSDGLLFLPYLTGERTPHPDPLARGAFVGLTLRHTRAHMTRAVMEGITFAMRDSLELIRELGVTPASVRASGGGAESALWRQMMADIFHASITTSAVGQGAAHGAVLLAGVGAGMFKSVEEAASKGLVWSDPVPPSEAQYAVYDAAYARYRKLYPALREDFAAAGE
ncbi:MAG: xylulokinase [Planctomycetota bacterium]|jgi:xylulokinase